MGEAARVLVVEDEAPILDGLVALFENQGFAPDAVNSGVLALERLAANRYDLVLLDLMIPGVPGLEVLSRIRAQGDDTPVLVLTAMGAEDDIVAGLEAGADDYVTKPFGVRELVARAKGLLRRRPTDVVATTVSVDGCALDFDALEITHGGSSVRLTAREGALLQHLVQRRHRPVSREELLVDVWGYRDGTIRTRTVDVHVQQLRAKLRACAGEEWIATVRGRGYRFAAQVDG